MISQASQHGAQPAVGPVAFRHRLVATEQDGPVAVLRVCRAAAGHSLNPAALFQLSCAIDSAMDDPAVQGVVITGSPGAFVSGADICYFVARLRRGETDSLMAFTEEGARLFERIEKAPKTVVAALNGSALGGGAELALACHHRVATLGASIAFPETGLGLVPGWGGVFRTARLLGPGLAKWLIYSGAAVNARDALAIGLIDAKATPYELMATARRFALGEGSTAPSTPLFNTSAIAGFFQRHTVSSLLDLNAETAPQSGPATLPSKLATKSPYALRLAEDLFEATPTAASDELIAHNLRAVAKAFKSPDALVGLEALLAGNLASVRYPSTFPDEAKA